MGHAINKYVAYTNATVGTYPHVLCLSPFLVSSTVLPPLLKKGPIGMGRTMVNGYTVHIIPLQLASDIKDCWGVAGNSPDVNPIQKISLAVQQLGDQLVIVPIHHPAPPTMKA